METEKKPNDKPGISVLFDDTPTHNIGYCMRHARFTLPGTENYRIWTFKKQDDTLQLVCNGVEIFNVSYTKISEIEKCKKRWSRDFAAILFGSRSNLTDTASNFYRPYSDG